MSSFERDRQWQRWWRMVRLAVTVLVASGCGYGAAVLATAPLHWTPPHAGHSARSAPVSLVP